MSTREERRICRSRGRRRTRRSGLGAVALIAFGVVLGAPTAVASERSGLAFDADEGLAGRDIVSLLADYDSDGALSAQVFFAAPVAATPATRLSVSFSPDPDPQACSAAGAAVITTLAAPGAGATLAHPALGAASAAVDKSVQGDSVSLSVRDPRLAGLGFGCVRAETTSAGGGSPMPLDALVPPLVLADVAATIAEAPLDLGGPGDDSQAGAFAAGGAPQARFAIVRGSLAALLGRGMVLSAQVNRAGRLRATLRVGRRTARRLGVRAEIARGLGVSRGAGRTRIRLRAGDAARSRIKRLASVAVTLTVRLEVPGAAPGVSVRRLRLR